MDKTITYAGVSIPLGKDHYVFRTATSQRRVDQLVKLGDVKIDIVGLPKAMQKVEAAEYLKSIDFANGDTAIQAALDKVTNAYYKKIYTESRRAYVDKTTA